MDYSSGEFCYPWTGIAVNIVKQPDSADEFENTEYWMKRFSKFDPEAVDLLLDDKKQTAQVLLRFKTDFIGFKNTMEFEKSFEAAHHSKKEWNASESPKGASLYGWLARANDFESQGAIGDYLRGNRELKTIADLVQEGVTKREKAMVKLTSEIDMMNENCDDSSIDPAFYEDEIKQLKAELDAVRKKVEEKKQKLDDVDDPAVQELTKRMNDELVGATND